MTATRPPQPRIHLIVGTTFAAATYWSDQLTRRLPPDSPEPVLPITIDGMARYRIYPAPDQPASVYLVGPNAEAAKRKLTHLIHGGMAIGDTDTIIHFGEQVTA